MFGRLPGRNVMPNLIWIAVQETTFIIFSGIYISEKDE
jgi:hypothetical protein